MGGWGNSSCSYSNWESPGVEREFIHSGSSRARAPAPHSSSPLFWDLEIYAAIVVGLGSGVDVQPGHRQLGGVLLVENPERAADNRVVLHFLGVLVEENQKGGGGDQSLA